MISRLFLKVLVFAIIVSYFLFYEYRHKDLLLDENSLPQHTTLLVQEQQIFKHTGLKDQQHLTLDIIVHNNIPYIDGQLKELTQLTEYIVLAKVNVLEAHHIKIKENEEIQIIYTGYVSNDNIPFLNKHYRWLINKDKTKSYYFIQGGTKGILSLE